MAEYFLGLNRERTLDALKAALAGGLEAARVMLKAGAIPVADIAGGLSHYLLRLLPHRTE